MHAIFEIMHVSSRGKDDLVTKKLTILKRISENLSYFATDGGNKFLCPTCLEYIPLSNLSEISEAHIVPRSAGGGLKSFLCTKCNSAFGANQDKWMGEYVKIKNNKSGLLASSKQKGYFEINGVRFSGEYGKSIDGAGEFYIFENKSNPESIKSLLKSRDEGSLDRLSITFSVPLIENSKQIDVGFLTSAYLLWFKELGYSWVFQSHLDIVREQIKQPEEDIMPKKYIVSVKEKYFERPWIGVVELNREKLPVMGMSDRLVFLPSASNPQALDEISNSLSFVDKLNYESLEFSKGHVFGGPLGVLHKETAIVCPDQFKDGTLEPRFVLFPGKGQPPYVLSTISEDDYHKLQKMDNTVHLKVKFNCISSDQIVQLPN